MVEEQAETSAGEHFAKRAYGYNQSSHWVRDEILIERIVRAAEVDASSVVLDLATGTGLVAAAFHRKVKKVVGVDISQAMARQALAHLDEFVNASTEELPFEDGRFDACVCRQGLQFVDIEKTIAEVKRVLVPGGRVVFCHLTAYGEDDREHAFRIQKLRNPARRNFFMPNDIQEYLNRGGYHQVEAQSYLSRESVKTWIDNGALPASRMAEIEAAYRTAPEKFIRSHRVEFPGQDIIDWMQFMIVKAKR